MNNHAQLVIVPRSRLITARSVRIDKRAVHRRAVVPEDDQVRSSPSETHFPNRVEHKHLGRPTWAQLPDSSS